MNIRLIILTSISIVLSTIAVIMSTYTNAIALQGYKEFLHEQVLTKREFASALIASNKKFDDAEIASAKEFKEMWAKTEEKIDAVSIQDQVNFLQKQLDILKRRVGEK